MDLLVVRVRWVRVVVVSVVGLVDSNVLRRGGEEREKERRSQRSAQRAREFRGVFFRKIEQKLTLAPSGISIAPFPAWMVVGAARALVKVRMARAI